jgi:hypothetical protein
MVRVHVGAEVRWGSVVRGCRVGGDWVVMRRLGMRDPWRCDGMLLWGWARGWNWMGWDDEGDVLSVKW